LLFLVVIFLFQLGDSTLHLLHVFLHGLDLCFKIIEFGATRWDGCSNRQKHRETNRELRSVVCNHKEFPGFYSVEYNNVEANHPEWESMTSVADNAMNFVELIGRCSAERI
jgi:hypothetical protein